MVGTILISIALMLQQHRVVVELNTEQSLGVFPLDDLSMLKTCSYKTVELACGCLGCF